MTEKEKYEILIKESCSYTEFSKKLGYNFYNGSISRKIKKIITDNDLSTKHFDGGKSKNIKYPTIIKKCPVCSKDFEAKLGQKKEKQTCSYGCANKHFRSGDNNGMAIKLGGLKSYSKICFKFHKKECIICGEDKIVSVHHFDHNHYNNEPKNLVPLCPTHHQYVHSRYENLVIDKINKYVENFTG